MTRDELLAKKRRAAVAAAANALSDLNTFGIVVSIMEGGHIHAPSNRTASRIIKLCQAEQQRRLRDYDRDRARAALMKEEGE